MNPAAGLDFVPVFLDLVVALVVAVFASRRDWKAWHDPKHPERMPMAESPWTWFAVCAIALPVGLVAYSLDRQRAPLIRTAEPEYARALAS